MTIKKHITKGTQITNNASNIFFVGQPYKRFTIAHKNELHQLQCSRNNWPNHNSPPHNDCTEVVRQSMISFCDWMFSDPLLTINFIYERQLTNAGQSGQQQSLEQHQFSHQTDSFHLHNPFINFSSHQSIERWLIRRYDIKKHSMNFPWW